MLNAQMVIDLAVASTDVADPDLAPFRENLDLVIDCMNREARIAPRAVDRIVAELASSLRNRIEVSDWVRRYPEIRDEVIDAPIFVTGLPRSGSTYFQYLFDPEPSMRMLRFWEGHRPSPPPGFAPDTIEQRITHCAELKVANQKDESRAKLAQIHLSDADGPEECLEIIDQTFANVGEYWPFRVPSYFKACLEGDRLLRAYEYHKLVLQLLQWRGQRRRWVLKWPCHLVALDQILAVYPDARFVVTHRDPVQALASNCSLTTILRKRHSDEIDVLEIGQQMRGMLLVYLEHLMDFAGRHDDRMAHVSYRTAVDRPEVAMAQAFRALGLEMTPSFEEAVVSWRRENPPGKRGTHDYALEDYGLDADDMARDFAFYSERFDIASERAVSA